MIVENHPEIRQVTVFQKHDSVSPEADMTVAQMADHCRRKGQMPVTIVSEEEIIPGAMVL